MATEIDPVMRRFRAALDEAYGDRIERVVLYGSRARGDARPDSDWDVAVFLKDLQDRWRESGALAEIETEILMDEGAVVNALPLEGVRFKVMRSTLSIRRIDGGSAGGDDETQRRGVFGISREAP
jgi:predicted nucleotidyltransferase